MKLSQEAVNKFRDLYLVEFGEELPTAEAESRALEFLQLVDVLSRLDPDGIDHVPGCRCFD